MDYISRARRVIDCEIAGIEKVRDGLGESFTSAVKAMLSALGNGSKLVVSGVGKNLHIAEKISATLASTGSTSVILNPTQAMHGDLGVLSKGDILLLLSYSGESEELLTLVPAARRLGVRIITLSCSHESALGRCSDIVIEVAIDREACPFNMAPTTSTTATLAVGDALAMVLLEARGFKREDYAKLHPGGAIGRALLLRVSDIMRGPDRVASVEMGAPVKDALVAMTQARSGSAGVVDSNGKVVGIFTDGDLRRNLASGADLLNLPVSQVMSANPKTVKATGLAVDVLQVFEQNNIDDLLVVDDGGGLIGAVDIQDLPKLKIL